MTEEHIAPSAGQDRGEMSLVGVHVDQSTGEPFVLLKEKSGRRYLRHETDPAGANAIAYGQLGIVPAAPLTHDTFRDILKAVDLELSQVEYITFSDGIFYSDLILSDGRRISARPTDAVALAVRSGAPVFATSEILENIGSASTDEGLERFPATSAVPPDDDFSLISIYPEGGVRSAHPELLIEMVMMGICVEEGASSTFVFLREKRRSIFLACAIDGAEANAIDWARATEVPPRPPTHHLIRDVLDVADVQLLRVECTALIDDIFYSDLVFSNGRRVSTRASDAIALALLADAQVFATSEIMDKAGHSEPGLENIFPDNRQIQSGQTQAYADADTEVDMLRRTVSATSPEHADHAMYLYKLATALRERFEQGGDWDDLDAAIDAGRRALEITPDDHADRAVRLTELGSSLHTRFTRAGDQADLAAAIEVLSKAAASLADRFQPEVTEVSPEVREIQQLSEQELNRLLEDTPAGPDLVGLLTAADGGLSAADLAALTGSPQWQIEEIVHATAGVAITRQASALAAETSPEVYRLGHEEFKVIATSRLAARLPGYRARLHEWVAGYGERGWPAPMPEYLLLDYFRMLADQRDRPRMTACALDAVRHDEMLRAIGGDTAALAEIRTTLQLIAAQDDPAVSDAFALAIHRDQLTDRSKNIPVGLPAVWAATGQANRAQALAISITDPVRRDDALALVADVLAGSGQYQRAEATARSISLTHRQEEALVQIAVTLAGAGQHEQAEALARSVASPDRQAEALARVAGGLAGAGQHRQAAAIAEQAEALARSVASPDRQAEALARVAGGLAGAGQHRQAAAIAEQAEALARSVASPDRQAEALARVAGGLAGAGQHRQAAAIAGQAEALARSTSFPRAEALAQIAKVLAQAGQYQQAEALARSIIRPSQQAEALVQVAGALAGAGRHRQAEAVARSISDQDRRGGAFAQIATALARAGDHLRAEVLAWCPGLPGQQAEALAQVAAALARTGQHQQGAAIAEEAKTLAQSIADPDQQAQALTGVAGALAGTGQHQQAAAIAEQAEALARSVASPDRQAEALARVAAALAGARQYQQAEALAGRAGKLARLIADPYPRQKTTAQVAGVLAEAGQYQQAEALARSCFDPDQQGPALAQVAKVLAGAGQFQRAEALAESITVLDERAQSLAQVAEALAGAGQYERAAAIAGRAEALARSITDPVWQELAMMRVARALPGAGLHRQAGALARSIPSLGYRAESLAEVAGALAQAGQHEQAAAVAGEAQALAPSIASPEQNGRVLAQVAGALARAGEYQRAEALTRSIRYSRDAALSQVAEAFAWAGQYEQAETLVRSMTGPDEQAEAFAQVANALVAAGDTRLARRAAAAACATGRWIIAAAPVLLLEPSAVKLIARVLKGQLTP
jgi:bifunctional DNase/RNase/tetratricopeptide (TPR) repeat protein